MTGINQPSDGGRRQFVAAANLARRPAGAVPHRSPAAGVTMSSATLDSPTVWSGPFVPAPRVFSLAGFLSSHTEARPQSPRWSLRGAPARSSSARIPIAGSTSGRMARL